MTLIYVIIFVLLGISLTTSAVAVVLILKSFNGFKIDVNLQHVKPPDPPAVTLADIQEELAKTSSQHEENVNSLDALIASLNEMMTGGVDNG